MTKNSMRVPHSSETFIAHCTHFGFDKFIKTHANYAKVEAKHSVNKDARVRQALLEAEKFDSLFDSEGESGLKYKLAWKVYNYMIVLNMLLPDEATVRDSYKRLLDEMTERLRSL